ncbi:MAG TPA: VCBS repeat-containing protein [Polyangia bacterium]|nr:VCBS repeat-containing protein [Polyangia bacterium]
MRAARLAPALLALAAAGLAAPGCDWRDFDDLQSRTPVLAVGAPSRFGTDDFGRTLLPMAKLPAGASGARYVVSAAAQAGIAVVDLDARGQPKSQAIEAPAVDPTEPLTALAEVPGTGQVLLGAPGADDPSKGTVYLMTLGDTPDVALFDAQPGDDRFGLGVAAGALAGGEAPDFVVVSGDALSVYVDGATPGVAMATPPPADCTIMFSPGFSPRDRLRRAVVVASLTGDPATQQIVVGSPQLDGQGAVSVFTVAGDGTATCAFTYHGADPRFGHALATGDFDGDGTLDLLVGSPPAHAFWIRGPLTPTSPILPVTLSAGGSELGSAVAAVNVDGKPGDEALVGNPDATVAGGALAGEVHVVTGAALTQELAVVRRLQPSAGDVLGIALAALPFCTSGCGTPAAAVQDLVLVGSNARAFTYYDLHLGAADPRAR